MSPATLGEVGEGWVLDYVVSRLARPEKALIGPGDDVCAFTCEGTLVVCSDMLVAETDVPPGMTWSQVGSKAITAVVSDFASKGAQPRYMLVDLGLRSDMTTDQFTELWSGLEYGCRNYRATIIGGDTNQCREYVIGVSGVGTSDRLMGRRGAKEGDLVAATGTFGGPAAGLHALLSGEKADQTLLDSVLSPRARLAEGLALASSGAVTSCIDSSDGLADCLHNLASVNGVGIRIDEPPMDAGALRYAEAHRLDPLELMLYGGEEYELVFTLRKDRLSDVAAALEAVGCELRLMGSVSEDEDVRVVWRGRLVKVENRGWQHFKSGGSRLGTA